MAKQLGLLRVNGTIGGMTFYQTKNGYCVREARSISADRIKKDPQFARTRENNSEFTQAMQSAKLLRSSISQLMARANDSSAALRLNQIMFKVGKSDATSVRGARNPHTGLGTATGKGLLKGFNFNMGSELAKVVLKPWTITAATGVIGIANFIPLTDMVAPAMATHFSISAAVGVYNFTTGVVDVKFTNVVNAAIGSTVVPVTLTPTALPAGTGIKLYFMKIEFFQLVNGVQYSLTDATANSLAIIEIA